MRRGIATVAIVAFVLGLVAFGAAVAKPRHASSAAHLPSGFASQMQDMNITYSDVAVVSDQVRSAALRAAARGSSPLTGKDARAVVVRVTFTDDGYRDHGRRIYVDRPALMLVYPDTPMALSGPPGTPSGTVKSTLVDFIDPDSMQGLRAVSFATSTHVDQTTGE
jgi:hypothetical protein